MYYFYLSFKFTGETPENQHQYISKYKNESDKMLFFEEKINPELQGFYHTKLSYSPPHSTIEFLEYHYSQYLLKNPGKQINFLYFIEESLHETFYFRYKDPEGDKFVTDEETISLLRQHLIKEWIEKKKKEIELIPEINPKLFDSTEQYCLEYYKEIEQDILFKKETLPHDLYNQYIKENLNKFANLIEDLERKKRAGNLNANGIILLESYHYTLSLWRQSYIEISENEPKKPSEKIKWNGTPSQFGHLFLELVKHGFIEPPLYNGETNYTGFARLCFQYFDIDTTPGNLENQLNPNKNQLSDTKRAKFTIPDLSDLR